MAAKEFISDFYNFFLHMILKLSRFLFDTLWKNLGFNKNPEVYSLENWKSANWANG